MKYFIGANIWYAAMLATTNKGKRRLCKELDLLKSNNIDIVRILASSEGCEKEEAKTTYIFQVAPGVYDFSLLEGLDFVMTELKKRNMKATLYLNNAWEWSGGFYLYLRWATGEHYPTPQEAGYQIYMSKCSEFWSNDKAFKMFLDHITFMMTRINTITGIKYTDDDTIYSWQLCNEPRPFADNNHDLFISKIKEATDLIRALDPKHLISIGTEGIWGCNNSYELCLKVHALDNVDYITCHIWPYNRGLLKESFDVPELYVTDYIDKHIEIAKLLNKPLIIDEFGFPRDSFRVSRKSKTTHRDQMYKIIFDKLLENKNNKGPFLGCCFWGWSGLARKKDFYADPPQEPQGFNSVFDTDTTTQLIKHYNTLL